MTTDIEIEAWRAKARENLASAASELANGRYNACANRAYYACFQAAIAALLAAGIRPPRGEWGHDFVQAQVAGQLIARRKAYPSALRDVLPRAFIVRQTADYKTERVSEVQATRTLRRAAEFVRTMTMGGGDAS
jgi:uncharacterized protein (UPF0332 family)